MLEKHPAGAYPVVLTRTFPYRVTISVHVTAFCRSGFFQLRHLRPFVRSLSTEATKTLDLVQSNTEALELPVREIRTVCHVACQH